MKNNKCGLDGGGQINFPCPVCRENVTMVLESLKNAKPPLEEEEVTMFYTSSYNVNVLY